MIACYVALREGSAPLVHFIKNNNLLMLIKIIKHDSSFWSEAIVQLPISWYSL